MPHQQLQIQITYSDLVKRLKKIPEVIEPILDEHWTGAKEQRPNTNSLKISVHNGHDWRLKTPFLEYRVGYEEEWINTKEKRKNEELWKLNTAYFTLYRRNEITENYDEPLMLHCWNGFEPESSLNSPEANEEQKRQYEKQKRQAKYQHSIHLHLKIFNDFDNGNKVLSKSHIALTLGRETYKFDSIESLDIAMNQAIILVKEEILELLCED